jgi:hypothetical protein
MDSQLFDWRPFLMDLKGQEAPNSLGRTQVTGLKILLNLFKLIVADVLSGPL